MMETKTFLLGLINIPMYHYNWTLTNAQIELIVSDKPISYIKPEKKKFSKPSEKSIQDTIQRFKERQSKKQ